MSRWLGACLAVGVIALVGGGYFANETMACNALEEDYLNSIATIKGNAAIQAVLPTERASKLTETSNQIAWAGVEATYGALYDRCGSRAAATAHRKGQDMLSAF